MSEMRILTVRQPWAWAIIHGGKDVENRVRNVAGEYRGPVAIHAALAIDADYDRSLVSETAGRIAREKRTVGMRQVPSRITDPDEPRFHVTERYGYRGAIIGVVDLDAVHHADDCYGCSDGCCGGCSGWAELDSHHLELANPRSLAKPIPYKGALGLRRLDQSTIDTITAALVAETGEDQ